MIKSITRVSLIFLRITHLGCAANMPPPPPPPLMREAGVDLIRNFHDLANLQRKLAVASQQDLNEAIANAAITGQLQALQVLCENDVAGAPQPQAAYIQELLERNNDAELHMGEGIQHYLIALLQGMLGVQQ